MTIWVALIGSIAGFLFGYDEGIIAGSLSLVREEFGLGHSDVGVMASALPFGAMLGAMMIGAWLASKGGMRWGRRPLLSFAGVLFLLGALVGAEAPSNGVLVLSRFVLGLAIGAASVITPLYLAETACERTRGAMVAVYQLAITLGIVAAYMVNLWFLEAGNWRMMFASSAVPAVFLIVGMAFLPESPRWLCSVGRTALGQKVLQRLRGENNIDQEWKHIQSTIAHEPAKRQWTMLFQRPLLPVLFLGMALFCLQQLCGINVIIYFAPEIFKSLGFANRFGQILATIGIGIVNVLVTVLAMLYLDTIGRRKLLLLGFAGTAMSLTVMSVCSSYQISGLAQLSVICLSVYIFSFAISIGPVPHIAMAEIFPLYVRGAGMGFSALSNWGFNTLMVFSFPLMHAHFGIASTFGIYAVVCVFGWLFTYHWMPETKGLSLETIEDHLMSGTPLRKIGRKPTASSDDVEKVYS